MGKKIIFYIIIGIFILTPIISYFSSSSMRINPATQMPETALAAEEKEEEKTADDWLEGTLRKAVTSEKTEYYLEISGVTLAYLKSTKNVDFDRYVDKDVKIKGDVSSENSGAIVDVAEVQLAQ